MRLSILIPFRDADGTRAPGKDWVVARWQAQYPDAEIVLAEDDGMEPFNKSMAVNEAFAHSTGDMIVILDADTWIEPDAFRAALRLVRDGAPWVIPAMVSHRLTREKTLEVLARAATDALPPIEAADIEQVSYVVGFCHVLPRDAFLAVGGMDERFRGWGGEDGAFVRAVDHVWGHHLKLHSTLVSLWHARPRDGMGRRTWVGQSSRTSSMSLWRRYVSAETPEQMLAILRERGGPLSLSAWHNAGRRRSPMGRVIFVCTRYPALMVRFGVRKLKFVGGRLAVTTALAPEVQAFADKHPEYGIAVQYVEQAAPAVDPALEPGSDEVDVIGFKPPLTYPELRQALKSMGLPVDGKKADLAARLDEALTAYR